MTNKVQYDFVKQMTTPLNTAGVTERLGRHYCPRMAELRKCTTDCTRCAKNIEKIFQLYKEFENVQEPMAVLVYCIRQVVEDIAEEKKPEPKAAVFLEEANEQDPFLEFASALQV